MKPRWPLVLVVFVALALSCFARGPLFPPSALAGKNVGIEVLVPVGSTFQCAALSCNRAPGGSSAPATAVALAGIVAATVIVVVGTQSARRRRLTRTALPDGTRFQLLHPPQR